MRIRTQLTILMLVFGAMLVVIVLSAIVTNALVVDAVAQGKLAAEISDGASELSYLSNDYMIYREPQQRTRWLGKYTAVSQDAAGLAATDPEEQSLVTSVQDSARRVKDVFDSIDTSAAPFGAGTADIAQLQVAWSRMGVQTQGLMTDAGRLAAFEQAQVDQALSLRTALIYSMIGLFGAFFLLNYFTMQRRILRALATLRHGAQVIGSGDLDYQIPVENAATGRAAGDRAALDEIGELSVAFNAMAAHLKENRSELQTYARRLVEASENERQMIARELHDEVGQVMTALKMSLTRLQRKGDLPPGMNDRLEEAKTLADRAIEDLRTLATALRPGALDRAGLVPALEQHIEQFRARTGLNVWFEARGFDDPDAPRLPPDTETNLYRIAQEALTNAARYAHAKRIDVTLGRTDRAVMLLVQDDGCGFDVEEGQRKGHLGLLGMRERAQALDGHLTIDSAPGAGAKIRVVAPITPIAGRITQKAY